MIQRTRTYTRQWSVDFSAMHALESFPHPVVVAEDIAFSPAYRSEGRYRTEQTCIFQYTLEGRGWVWSNERRWEVPVGHGFLAILNDVETRYGYPDEENEPWKFIWISFAGGNSRAMVRELIDTYGPVYALAPDNNIIKQLRSFETSEMYPHILPPMTGEQLLFHLLTDLGKAAAQPLENIPHDALTKSILELLELRQESGISVNHIAKQLGLSREHISRSFHARQGIPLRHYILQKKMLIACHLLKESSLSIKEISHGLGYDTPTNFTRAFRKMMLLNPRDFRKFGTIPAGLPSENWGMRWNTCEDSGSSR